MTPSSPSATTRQADPRIPSEVTEAIKGFGQAQYDYGHGDCESRGRGVHMVVQMHAALVAAISMAIEEAANITVCPKCGDIR